jgi:hypothetical protein
MLKCASKFFAEKVLPSVLATVTAAYIVNHYIARPADAPPTAAAALPDRAGHNDSEAGVRAKGISENAIAKVTAEKVRPETAAERPDEKRAETAGSPADVKKHRAARREKATRVASVPAAPVQTASAPDDHRDANDLARAAIDRLRGANDASPRVEGVRPQPEVARAQRNFDRQSAESTSTRLQEAARAAPQPAMMQPLPPPIQVSVPAVETPRLDAESGEESPSGRADDHARLPVPPADIPQAARPLDLEANAAAQTNARTTVTTTVADDMLSAAKSVVQAVLPQ